MQSPHVPPIAHVHTWMAHETTRDDGLCGATKLTTLFQQPVEAKSEDNACILKLEDLKTTASCMRTEMGMASMDSVTILQH